MSARHKWSFVLHFLCESTLQLCEWMKHTLHERFYVSVILLSVLATLLCLLDVFRKYLDLFTCDWIGYSCWTVMIWLMQTLLNDVRKNCVYPALHHWVSVFDANLMNRSVHWCTCTFFSRCLHMIETKLKLCLCTMGIFDHLNTTDT